MPLGAKLAGVGLLAAVLLQSAALAARPTLKVDKRMMSAAQGTQFAIKINMPRPGDVSLKVYDPAGKFVRSLAHRQLAAKELAVTWDLTGTDGRRVAPGIYSLRLECGPKLEIDRSFATSGVLEDKSFVTPRSLRLDQQGNLYILDTATSTLFKFTSQGKASNDWKGTNTITAPTKPCWGCVAVEPDGSRMYLSESMTTRHVVDVYDGKTATELFTIGAFFGDDAEWKNEKGGIVYPHWVGLSGDNRLYTDCPGYARIWAFDRRKEGKAGGVWQLGGKYAPRQVWHSPGDCGDTDGAHAIYLASYDYHQRAQLFKVLDLGQSARFAYDMTKYVDPRSKKEVPLKDIYGVAYDGEQGLYVVERGSVRILKIADTEAGFEFIAALGRRGKNLDRVEFTSPHAAVVTPDGKLLYIVDGEVSEKVSDKKKIAPIGPSRVARYKIGYRERNVLKLTVRP